MHLGKKWWVGWVGDLEKKEVGAESQTPISEQLSLASGGLSSEKSKKSCLDLNLL